MGLLARLSRWLAVPPPGLYQCTACGCRFETDLLSCPECGGEVNTAEVTADMTYYWGPM